ncbi:hypothetical protein G6011_08543 [Alternaria panax]|uniref:AMP-dependent synthetase/ligase domain-containing protein n=1 Tax=Alternaria panax TaxID=48097 RepID=A0AAD4I668_9PLEO|nr:hypothetical protein G6011_08543 [Alternaria panax]
MDLIDPAECKLSMERGIGLVLEVLFTSVLERLQEVVTAMPHEVAVKDERDNATTYIDLLRRAIAMSSDLKCHGVGRGTPVCVIGPPTIDLLYSVIAIWCVGGIYVPVDHHLSIENDLLIAKNSATKFCVVSAPDLMDFALDLQLDTVFYCGDMVYAEGFDEVEKPLSDDVAVGLQVPSPDDTSKGVMLTHENLKTIKPVVLQHSDWLSDLALFQILFALTSGGTLILAVDPISIDISNIMVQQEITITIATPSEYSTWSQQSLNMLKHCKSWKFALSIGENMSSSIVRSFTELANLHGATETTVACSVGFVEYREYAADKKGVLVPIAGPGIGVGYFNSEDDKERFHTHPETGSKCFCTRNWGFTNDTGELFVVSRCLDESIAHIQGFQVELGDVSRTIVDQANDSVLEAVVI